jgi:hypothetical protein
MLSRSRANQIRRLGPAHEQKRERMSQKRTRQIERRIDRIKKALLEIGAMRPSSLSRQYKDPQHHTGAYWQISDTRQKKSRTEYVRQESLKEIRTPGCHPQTLQAFD